MRLVVMTPRALVVDCDVVHVRAEDPSGAFGMLDRHADLLTALTVSVLVYRDAERREHFVAVRGGLLRVMDRRRIEVLTREAVASDNLASLQGDVLVRFRLDAANEQRARAGAHKLESNLLTRVMEYVRGAHGQAGKGLRRWGR